MVLQTPSLTRQGQESILTMFQKTLGVWFQRLVPQHQSLPSWQMQSIIPAPMGKQFVSLGRDHRNLWTITSSPSLPLFNLASLLPKTENQPVSGRHRHLHGLMAWDRTPRKRGRDVPLPPFALADPGCRLQGVLTRPAQLITPAKLNRVGKVVCGHTL